MSKVLKFVILPVIFIAVTIYFIKRDINSALNLGFEGEVVSVIWKSRNHGLPLIEIRNYSNNKIVVFSHYKIALQKGDLKIGDKISKVRGKKQCYVNDTLLNCIK